MATIGITAGTDVLVAAYNNAVETCNRATQEDRFNDALGALTRIGAELDRRDVFLIVNDHGYARIATPHAREVSA